MIGISIGSQNTCIGVLKNNNVDIILSETSSRSIPTLVSFTETERIFGDGALSTAKSNFSRTIFYPNRYLGLEAGEFLEQERKLACSEIVVDDFYRAAFQADFKGHNDKYIGEAIMGIFFNKIKLSWKNLGYETKDVVVTVPDYFNCNERKAMIDAVNIAELNCLSLINDSSAVSLNYGLFRRSQFEDTKPRIVGFVDMGQSKTSIFFSSFTKNTQKVFSVTSERFLGARDFDYSICEFFSAVFKKKTGLDVISKPKLRIRMLEAIAKMRKILSSNREATINIESLMDDEDFSYTLSRDDFHKIIDNHLKKFDNLLKQAIIDAKINVQDLHSVEMVGDAIRTPILQQFIKDIYGKEISKTLAPDECHARGATLFAAMSSPYFSLKDFTFEHCNPYTIQFEYPFVKDGTLEIRNTKIISKGENLPNKKSIKFSEKQLPKQSVLELKLSYNKEENIAAKDMLLKTYHVTLPSKMDEQFTFSLQFLQDSNGLPHIDKASVVEVKYEEVPIKPTTTTTTTPTTGTTGTQPTTTPSTNPGDDTTMKDATNEAPKTEKVKKEVSNNCPIKLVDVRYGIDHTVFENIKKKETHLENEDRLLRYAKDKRNEMETYIYTTREKLEYDLAGFVDSKDKEVLLNVMSEIKSWFESEVPEITLKSAIDEKNGTLTNLGDRIYKRKHDWERLDETLPNFQNSLNSNIQRITEEYNKLSNKQASYLTMENVEELKKIVEKFQEIYNNALASLAKAIRFIDPPVSYEAMVRHIKDFNDQVNTIFNNAEKKVKDELKRIEREKKEREDKERKDKEKEKKDKEAKDANPEKPKTENKMDVD